MVQIIEENITKRPSFLEGLMGLGMTAAGAAGQNYMQREQKKAQQMQMQQENERIKELTGMDLSSVQDPKMRQKAFELAMQEQQNEKQFGRESQFKNQQQEQSNKFKQSMTAQQALDDFNQKQELQYQKSIQQQELEGIRQQKKPQEKPKDLSNLRSGLKTVQAMRQLREKGNLGIGASYSPFGRTREDAAKYAQLGKSLISLASNIPIRNQKEFETLAHDLYDPNLTDAASKGILDAMEQIISQGLEEGSGKEIKEDKMILDSLSDEEIQKLFQETNGDLNAAKKLAMERYGR